MPDGLNPSKYFDPEAIFKEQLGFIRNYKLKTYTKADIDLSTARTEANGITTAVYDIPGNNLAVVLVEAECYIKFNEPDNAWLDLREQREILDAPFYRFWIKNAAAAGKQLKLRIGRASLFRAVPLGTTKIADSNSSDIDPTEAATTPTIYNITMTLADTEYDQALPTGTKKFTMQCRDGTAFRFAFETGKVATPTEPYFSNKANEIHYEDGLKLTSKTLYVACASAGKVVELLCWA